MAKTSQTQTGRTWRQRQQERGTAAVSGDLPVRVPATAAVPSQDRNVLSHRTGARLP